jgi:hypothetical protein
MNLRARTRLYGNCFNGRGAELSAARLVALFSLSNNCRTWNMKHEKQKKVAGKRSSQFGIIQKF